MKRTLPIVVLSVLVLAASAAPATATTAGILGVTDASAAATDSTTAATETSTAARDTTATSMCESVDGENVVVVAFPTPDPVATTGTETVYAGTTLTLAVCSRGQPEQVGTAWGLIPQEGVEILDSESEESVTIRITTATDEIMFDGDAIDRKQTVKPLTLTVIRPAATESVFDNETVRFSSQRDLQRYTAQEEAYLAAEQTVQQQLAVLERATNEPVEAVDAESIDALERGMQGLESATGDVAWTLAADATRSGDTSGFTAANNAHDRTDEIRTAVRTQLDDYENAANAKATEIVFQTSLSAAIAMLPGLLVGLALGAANPRRHFKLAMYDKQYVETQIERDAALPAVAAGAVLVVIALGLLAMTGAPGVVIEMVL